jgi:glycosyltransferase involved in cell wall biosynthesis
VTLRILIVHPSALLTDHLPSGDGLAANEFVRRLGLRGHRLHVACQRIALLEPLPDAVALHRLGPSGDLGTRQRLGYMRRLRMLFERIRRTEGLDVAHQLNPVDVGLSLALPSGTPLLLGPYVPDWPPGSEGEGEGEAPGARARRAARDAVRRIVRAQQQRRATTVLLSTPAAREKLASGASRPAVQILPFGVDTAALAPAEPRPRGRPTVLFLGSVSHRKGVFTLVAAHERVVARVPGARLLIAGAGEDEAQLRVRIARSSARTAIELRGPVPREGVAATMALADVVCMPSYGEPFGLSALEAMACGLPVVGTAAGGLQHVIPEDGGLTVPPRDATALADALAALLEDPPRRDGMGRANRRRVESTYSWETVVDRLERLYEAALSGR